MNILLVGPHPPATGGISSHVFDLARALADNGNNVTVFCGTVPNITNQKCDYETYTNRGYKVSYNDLRVFNLPNMLVLLNRLAKNSDIIHALSYKSSFLVNSFKKLNRRKVVTTLHSYYVYEKTKLDTHYIRLNILKFIERKVIEDSDALISVDSRIAKWVSKAYDREVDLISKNSLYFKDYEHYKNKNRELIITCPRHLYPKNGVHVAIHAIAELSKKYDASLHIIGEGPERPFLEKLIRNLALRNVVLHGNRSREETVSIIARSKLVLIPSIPINGLEEATSIAALEAMAVGTPVVASNVGGLKEILSDRSTGLLVSPNNPRDLAGAIEELLTDDRLCKTLKENSQKHVRENHDWSKNVVFIEKLYRGLHLREKSHRLG